VGLFHFGAERGRSNKRLMPVKPFRTFAQLTYL